MVGYANGRVVEVVDDIHCDEVELVHDDDDDVLDVVMAGVVVNQEWEEVAVVISLVSSS
jgi:hypothetical protein